MVSWYAHFGSRQHERARGSGVIPLPGTSPLLAQRRGLAREAPPAVAAQLTLPLSTISFCRLVDVITRRRMACQDQVPHVILRVTVTQPSWGHSRPLTFISSVQELRILGRSGGERRERWVGCSAPRPT